METLEVKLSKGWWIVSVLTGVLTFGLSSLFLWVNARNFPKQMDQEGITLRSGKRVLWDNIDRDTMIQVQEYLGAGVKYGSNKLEFKDMDGQDVWIVPTSLEPADLVVEFARNRLQVAYSR